MLHGIHIHYGVNVKTIHIYAKCLLIFTFFLFSENCADLKNIYIII